MLEQHAWQDQPDSHRKDDQERGGAVRNDTRKQICRCMLPDRDQLERPLATRNRKRPRIIETTAEKPRTPRGSRKRSATGVLIIPTRMLATSAPVAASAPARATNAQRAACPSMPTTIGNGSKRQCIEKNVASPAAAHPAAITSAPSGTCTDDRQRAERP